MPLYCWCYFLVEFCFEIQNLKTVNKKHWEKHLICLIENTTIRLSNFLLSFQLGIRLNIFINVLKNLLILLRKNLLICFYTHKFLIKSHLFYVMFIKFNTFSILVPYLVTNVKAFSCDDLIYAAKYIDNCVHMCVRKVRIFLLFKHIFNI